MDRISATLEPSGVTRELELRLDSGPLGLEYVTQLGRVVVERVTNGTPADAAGLGPETPFFLRRIAGCDADGSEALVQAVSASRAAGHTTAQITIERASRRDDPAAAVAPAVPNSGRRQTAPAVAVRSPSVDLIDLCSDAASAAKTKLAGAPSPPRKPTRTQSLRTPVKRQGREESSGDELSPLPLFTRDFGSPLSDDLEPPESRRQQERRAAKERPRAPTAVAAGLTWEELQGMFDGSGKMQRRLWVKAVGKVLDKGCADMSVRRLVWPYFLQLYPVESTEEEREKVRQQRRAEYEQYLSQYRSVTEAQRSRWSAFSENERQVLRDVLRTDRKSALFGDEDGQGMTALRNVLLAHLMFHMDLGYCQGMSDVAALLYRVLRDESLTFWGFVYAMEGLPNMRRNFAGDMQGSRDQLLMLRRLLSETDGQLARQLSQLDPAFLFAFRWITVRFKREFPTDLALRIWDAILACPTTGDFHLLLACSMLRQEPLRTLLMEARSPDDLVAVSSRLREIVDVQATVAAAAEVWAHAGRRAGAAAAGRK
eukprot:TRINITY_DN19459_c0_g1_i1.p1 TRINITY_DN19459_c0_g1~~TRINITY_DN19459_c0_g1_i1.p1  ORF type:complete len:542 (+),score=160.83 TRINITY_DN19459_c0_g1_i1:78-1703(+)